jgi:hypothetical protein
MAVLAVSRVLLSQPQNALSQERVRPQSALLGFDRLGRDDATRPALPNFLAIAAGQVRPARESHLHSAVWTGLPHDVHRAQRPPFGEVRKRTRHIMSSDIQGIKFR